MYGLLLPRAGALNVSLNTFLLILPIQKFLNPPLQPASTAASNSVFVCLRRGSEFPQCDVMVFSDRKYNLIVTHPFFPFPPSRF